MKTKKSFLLIELILYVFFFAFIWIYISFSAYSIISSVKKNYLISKFSSQYMLFLEEISNRALQWWDFYTWTKYELIFKRWDEKRWIICSWWKLMLTNIYTWADFDIFKNYEYIDCLWLSWWIVKWWYWIKLDLLLGDEKIIELPYYFYNWFRM